MRIRKIFPTDNEINDGKQSQARATADEEMLLRIYYHNSTKVT